MNYFIIPIWTVVSVLTVAMLEIAYGWRMDAPTFLLLIWLSIMLFGASYLWRSLK